MMRTRILLWCRRLVDLGAELLKDRFAFDGRNARHRFFRDRTLPPSFLISEHMLIRNITFLRWTGIWSYRPAPNFLHRKLSSVRISRNYHRTPRLHNIAISPAPPRRTCGSRGSATSHSTTARRTSVSTASAPCSGASTSSSSDRAAVAAEVSAHGAPSSVFRLGFWFEWVDGPVRSLSPHSFTVFLRRRRFFRSAVSPVLRFILWFVRSMEGGAG